MSDMLPDKDEIITALERIVQEQNTEIKRLQEKCDKQAMVFRRLTPENYPGVLFIHGFLGEVDDNGLPDGMLVVPSYGCDWSQVYQKADKIMGGMGS